MREKTKKSIVKAFLVALVLGIGALFTASIILSNSTALAATDYNIRLELDFNADWQFSKGQGYENRYSSDGRYLTSEDQGTESITIPNRVDGNNVAVWATDFFTDAQYSDYNTSANDNVSRTNVYKVFIIGNDTPISTALTTDASNLDASEYTAESWASYVLAATAAQGLIDGGNYNYHAINNAVSTLATARDALQEQTYSITENTSTNGTFDIDSASSVTEGTVVNITTTPNAGYEVDTVTVIDAKDNIITVSGSNNAYSFTMPQNNVTISVTFRQLLTVTFKDNDNTTTYTTKTTSYQTALDSNMPTALTKDGYYFMGWNTSAGQTTANFDETTVVTENTTVYPAYKIIIDMTGLSLSCESIEYSGDEITFTDKNVIETLPTGTTLTFSASHTYVNTYTDNATLTAQEGHIFADGTTSKTVTVTTKITATASSIETLPTFGSVYVGQNLSVVTITGGEGLVSGTFSWKNGDTRLTSTSNTVTLVFTPTSSNYTVCEQDVTVTATQITLSIPTGITVTGSETTTVTGNVLYGETLTFTVDTLANGYEVDTFTIDGITATTGETKVVSGPIAIVFTTNAIDYTITFASGTGYTITATKNDIAFTTGNTVTVEDTLVFTITPSTGYTAGELTASGTNRTFADNTLSGVYADVTISGSAELTNYTVTFVSGFEDVTAPETLTNKHYNEEITLSTLSKTGYTFNGWTIQGGDSTVYTTTYTMTTEDVTLVGNWSATGYRITFDDNDDNAETSVSLMEYIVTDGIVTLSIPTERTGYTFVGWFGYFTSGTTKYFGTDLTQYDSLANANLTASNDFVSIPASTCQDLTFIAKWEANEYTLTINYVCVGRGTASTTHTSQVAYNGSYSVTSPSLTGYTADTTTVAGTMDNIEGKTITVTYTANTNTEYTVKHFKENLTYTNEEDRWTEVTADAETETGTTDTDTAAVAKEYTGFTAQAITQVNIAGDGSAVVNVYYTRNTYKITWVNGETTVETDENVKYGATPSYDGATPTKDATAEFTYTFAGWTPIVSSVSGAQTYTATYSSTINTYTVTFYDEDGITSLGTSTVNYGTTASCTESTPTKAQDDSYTYAFANWYTATTEGSEDDLSNVTANRNVYARYTATARTYTVTYVENDGTDLSDTSYTYGQGLTLPTATNISKTGYTFAGWTVTNEAIDVDYITEVSTSATGDKTFYAKWTINDYILTINYVYAGGGTASTTHTEEITYNNAYSVESPSVTGYTVDTTTVAGTMGANDETITVTYTARTDTNYTVKHWQQNIINDEYTEYHSEQVTGTTDTQTAVGANTYTGFVAQAITQVNIDRDGMAVVNVYYNRETYTITWVNGETTVETDENVKYGATPSYDGATPTKDATAEFTYTFAGWTPIVSSVSGAQTYTATYNQTTNAYDITYTNTEEISLSGDATATVGQTVMVYVSNIAIGYEIVGVTGYKTGDEETTVTVTSGEGYWSFVQPTYAVTIVAQTRLVTYTITYNAGTSTGGSVPTSQFKTHGEDYTILGSPYPLTKDGYVQIGWVLYNEQTEDPYNTITPETLLTQNIEETLYPLWRANLYDLTLSLTNVEYYYTAGGEFNGGADVLSHNSDFMHIALSGAMGYSLPSTITITRANGVGTTTLIRDVDYNFSGEGVRAEGTDYCYNPESGAIFIYGDSVTNDITITASGNIVEYNIEYNANGGTLTTEQTEGKTTYNINSTDIDLPTPTKTGYTFIGWFFKGVNESDQDVYAGVSILEWLVAGNEEVLPPMYASLDDENLTTANSFTTIDCSVMAEYFGDDCELIAKWEANEYTLTINYVYVGGGTDSTTHTSQVAYNGSYSVESPSLTGYTADTATVTGIMDSVEGKTITVTYTANNYTLTINYVYAGGGTASTTHTSQVAYNGSYSVESPSLTGYTADTTTVAGTMDNIAGKTVTVTYTVNSYTLTINYYYVGTETTIATQYTSQVDYNGSYNVVSPVIENYGADKLTVTGTMDSVEGKTINVYYSVTGYSITFKGNDNTTTYETKNVLIGASLGANMPEDLSLAGKYFIGWNTSAGQTTANFNNETVVTENTTVYPAYKTIIDLTGLSLSYTANWAGQTISLNQVTISGVPENTSITTTAQYVGVVSVSENVTLQAQDGYIFADGTTSKTVSVAVTINPGTNTEVVVNGYVNGYDGQSHSISVTSANSSIYYSTDAGEEKNWVSINPTFADVTNTTVYYKVVKTNYNDVYGSASVIITPVSAAVTLSKDAYGYEYGSPADIVSATTNPSGLSVTYLYTGTGYSSNDMPTAVGEYTVTASVGGNYVGSDTATYVISLGTITGVHADGAYNGQYTGDTRSVVVTATTEDVTIEYSLTNLAGSWRITPFEFVEPTNGIKTIYYKVSKDGYTTVTGSAVINITKLAFENVVANGFSGEYDGQVHGISVSTTTEGAVIEYSTDSSATKVWSRTKPEYMNAMDSPVVVYYRITKAYYTTEIGSKTIDIRKATVITEETLFGESDGSKAPEIAIPEGVEVRVVYEQKQSDGSYVVLDEKPTTSGEYKVTVSYFGDENHADAVFIKDFEINDESKELPIWIWIVIAGGAVVILGTIITIVAIKKKKNRLTKIEL